VIEGGDEIDSMTYTYQRRGDEPEVDPWGG
jgi:hypothetical protein